MTVFDAIVLLLVGAAAIGGFMRGFTQEVLSLGAWVLAVLAISALHTDLTAIIYSYFGTPTSAAILAFVLLLLIPYAAMKVIANNISPASKGAILGPIDRVLGFGFGAVKGVVITVVGFALLVLGYDDVWGYRGRPEWIVQARSYELVDSSSRALVEVLAERRARLRQQQQAREERE